MADDAFGYAPVTLSRLSPARLAAALNADVVERALGRDRRQFRQREIGDAVAAILGTDQAEQRLVLEDQQELALAGHKADRREVEGENLDLSDCVLHGNFPNPECERQPYEE